ncbi:helix-turn-helix domain-containing protein [Streptomyces phaeofaciens JCM 4814]|uniref:AraC family transcriptional regulator n=1 Tax=Streptomyces phaeofaciens TaxID=68254 RepID=A0A918H2G4_9ACTN|nr:helix-turn-helix domain-containing protein [Streptomyces phaeofaciens]GGT31317.1 AraC family transcriptional regulator [Streptomyces phaeofaciens]
MALVCTTASVPDGEKLAYWRDALGRALVPMAVTARGDGPFSGRVSTDRLGWLRVSTVEADAQRTSRTAAHIARSAADYVAVAVQTAGTATLLQDGRRALVGESDLMVYDTARPYSLDCPRRFSALVVHMPRRAVGLPEEDLRRVTGTAVAGTDGLGALLASFLTTLTSSVPPCSPAVAARLASSAVDLFATLVNERTAGDGPPEEDPHHHLVPRIRDHIDRRLGDPELSPQSVAAAHHISVRYLHRLFEEEGVTVGRLIRRRRLEECARELSLRGPSAPTVSAVAQRWGFANPAHFSRVFRTAYGLSPREWRGAGARLPLAG